MRKKTLILSLALLILLLAGSGATLAQSGSKYDLSWWTVDGGGGTTTGGGYYLTGTVGQSDAGNSLTGGEYALYGGFWAAAGPTFKVHLPLILRNS